MVSSNWEDWAMALPLAFVAVFGVAATQTRTPELTSVANAAEHRPDYIMTITATRLPAECKGAAASPYCATLPDTSTVTMRKPGK